MIGPALTYSNFVETTADKVIAIEKGGLFTRFIEEKVHEKFNAILVLTAGQAPRATRHFIHRLNKEMELPVYIFSVDADEIIMVKKNGLLKTVRIGEYVDSEIEKNGSINFPALPGYERCCINDGEAMTVSSEAKIKEDSVQYGIRHKIAEDLYSITVKGGYNVKITGSHSVMVYDHYDFVPELVSDLDKDDLLAVCFNPENGTQLTRVNLVKLILNEAPKLANKIWVVGEECEKIKVKYSEDPTLWRRIMRRAVPLNDFVKRGIAPQKGKVRWGKSEIRVPITLRATSELMRLLGYYAAEGCISSGAIQLSFGSEEKSYVKDAVRCIEKTFSCPSHVYEGEHEIFVRFGGKLLCVLFEKVLKAGVSAKNKAVPFIVFNVPTPLKIEFLLGYYRGDGHMGYRKEHSKVRLIAKTVSRKLASDLILLLAQLKTSPYVEHKKPGRKWHTIEKTGQFIKASESYVVVLRDRGSLQKLLKIVEDLNPDAAPFVRGKVEKSPIWFSVPKRIVWEARNSLRKYVKPQHKNELETFLQHGIYGYKRISYRKLKRIFSYLTDQPNDKKLRFVKNLLENRILLLPITKIRKTKPTTDRVYDIKVGNNSTFLGGLGPILLHNTDGDPWGMHIAMVVISGSANAAHLRELATPDAEWSGVWASDIVDYDLPSDPLTDVDTKRLHELQKDPRYTGKLWQREVKTFLKIRKKAEQEAFSRYGLTYIVDEYLPAKLQNTK
ncbi:MAG: LAGLIDADG family homing endonuclease [Thermoproteota archaeon]|nr:LAGLIDADG family homing endonuclease [Thermoproteota archaeon]